MTAGRAPLVEFSDGAVFRGYLPLGPLARAVELIWTVRGQPDVPQDRVLPNGVVELIINLGEPQRVVHGPGRFTRYHRALVAGLQRRPLDIASERGSRLVGIRFRPGGAAGLLGLPLSALTDQVVEIEGTEREARVVRELRDRLLDARDDGEVLAEVEARLGAALLRGPGVDARVQRAVRALSAGPLSVRQLAGQLGASHKHLIQLFQRQVGVGPKMLGRILRFQRVLAALERPAPVAWADLAYACGYADQAHLCGEFRALAGIVPTAYHRRRTVDPNHLRMSG